MHYRPPQSNFRGGHVPRVPRGIYAYGKGASHCKVYAHSAVTSANKNLSADEIANVNFYAVRPEGTRIR